MISDADKALVKVTFAREGMQLTNGGFVRQRVVTFTVADKGPYSIAIPLADYTADAVWEKIGAEIATLRGIGAL